MREGLLADRGRLVAATCAAVLVGACGGNSATSSGTTVATNSQLHTMSGGGSAYAVAFDSRGRGAFVVPRLFQSQQDAEGRQQEQETAFRICAEPSPDVSSNLTAEASRAIEAGLQLSYSGVSAAGNVASQSSSSGTSTIGHAVDVSEVVLVLRSAMYRICELQINGTIEETVAKELFVSVMSTVQFMASGDHLPAMIGALQSPSDQLGNETRQQLVRAILAISLARMTANPGLPSDLRESFRATSQSLLGELAR